MRALISSISKEFSVHKYYLTLKSQGVKVSKNTLYTYLSMLADVLFVFHVQKFDYSVRKRDITISKVYLNDTCFAKIGEFARDIGRKMENIIFLELERRKRPLSDIFYWKNREQEVDFVIKSPKGVEELLQVCYDPTDIDAKKREIRALIKASNELRCKNLKVITWDYEDVEQIEGREIKYISLWKWLLNVDI